MTRRIVLLRATFNDGSKFEVWVTPWVFVTTGIAWIIFKKRRRK